MRAAATAHSVTSIIPTAAVRIDLASTRSMVASATSTVTPDHAMATPVVRIAPRTASSTSVPWSSASRTRWTRNIA